MCTSRMIVEEPVYDEFCEKFTAYAKDHESGRSPRAGHGDRPLIKKEQCALIDGQIEDAVSKVPCF